MMNRWIYFDCDDTLVMWPPYKGKDEDLLHIRDPYSPWNEVIGLYPHKRHIELLLHHANEDDIIVVWSAGGKAWADAVVEALGLQNVVHHTLTKPYMYVDDLSSTEFMGKHIYREYK